MMQEDISKSVSHIRNRAKKRYAIAYLAWRRNGGGGNEPGHDDLGHMAAQSVRLAIAQYEEELANA